MQKFTKGKGWRIWLFTVIAFCFALNLSAQVTVTIGNGTSTSGYPFYTLYEDGRTQVIYDASEIIAAGGMAGNITSIAFNVSTVGSPAMNGFNLDMQNYSGTTLTGFVSTGWTNTYSGVYTVAATGWQTITLTTPFAWDGTSNLLMNICWDNAAWSGNSYVYSTAATGKTWHQHTDGAAGCALAVGAVQANRPNIQLTINSAPPPPPPVAIQIGTGTTTVSYPYNTLWEDSRTQMIYDASEILAAGGVPGSITSIAFNVTQVNGYVMNGFNIDMQNYSGSTLAAYVSSGWTNTYSGTYTVTSTGWQFITLTTPFVWDGISNLLINVCFDNTGYNGASLINGSAIASKTYAGAADGLIGCSMTSGNVMATRPNIQMTITPSGVLPMGIVQGFVTNGYGVPMPDATVAAQGISGNYSTTSGPNGAYMIPDINIGSYTMGATKDGYNTIIVDGVLISSGATTYQNFALTQPSMAVTPNPYSVTVNPNELFMGALNINNNGNGPLEWTAEVIYPDDANRAPLAYCAASGGCDEYISRVQFGTIDHTSVCTNYGDYTAVSTQVDRGETYPITITNPVPYSTDVAGVYIDWNQNELFTDAGEFYPTTSSGGGASFTGNILVPDDAATGPTRMRVRLQFGGTLASCGSTSYGEVEDYTLLVKVGGWLILGQETGTVNAFTNFSLPAHFDAEGTEAGEVYTAEVVFTSDPDVGTITVPVTMVVSGPALNVPDNLTAVLSNPITGQVNLNWTFTPSSGFINFVIRRDGVQVGTTAANTFTNILPTYGTYSYTVQAVYADGQSSPAGPVEVQWNNPTMMVNPTYIYDEVWVNNQVVETVTISNTGLGTLAFSFPEWVDDDGIRAPLAYCAASGGGDESISNVQIGTINNSTGYSASGYGDYTAMSTEVEPGETYPISVSNPVPYTSDLVGIYIDWNQNELFTDAGEFYATTQSGGGALFNGNILVPDDALPGLTRMRVRLQWGGTLSSCGTTSYGEVEDYTLEVGGGGFIVSVVPSQGNIPAGGSRTIAITWDATDYAPGASYTQELVVESNDLAHPSVTINNEMYVYLPAQLAGTVTNANTDEPLNGVTVTADGYQTTTDENGEYMLYVDADTYDVSFAKTGFQSHIEMGVAVLQGVITTLNAELWEEAYPPSFVYAEVNPTDTQCVVTWGNGMGPYEIIYDDGSAENFAAWALRGNMNAVKFTPAEYPSTVIGGKIYVGDGSFPNNNTGFLGTTFGAMVKDDDGAGGLPGTTLDSISVTVDNYGWVTFSGLNAEITSGNFYLVMVQGAVSPNCAPVGIDQTLPTVFRSYSRNVSTGGSWAVSPYQDMMMRAIVYGTPAATDALVADRSTGLRTPIKQRGLISQSAPLAQSGIEGQGSYRAALEFEEANRSVSNYRVIRYSNFDPNGNPTLGTMIGLANSLNANTYTDGGSTWANLPNGWYAYGVAANYPGGFISDTIVSNIVGHGLLVDVTCNVSLTTGGSPAGAVVSLAGQDYPYEVYTQTVPEDGTVIFEDIWKGNYILEAMKVGFDDYVLTPNITSNRTFDILLLERKYIPRNLYVDALTLVATWDEPLAIAVMEDFEGSVFPPAGWQAITQNTTGWYATTNGSSTYFVIPTHSKYAVTNDDADNGDGCCDYLITPEMNWTDLPTYRLNFSSFFDGGFGQSAYVEISTDAGATWTVINSLVAASTWQDLEIDLAQFSGATGLGSVWVAFHADDNGAWASGWAVDDIVISSGGVPLQGYGVFLDGTLVDNTLERTYTYQDLNYGQEYLAGVAALFSSGYSELDTYRFRSLFLYPPQNLQGESPYHTDYAHLWWEQPGGGSGTGGSFIEDFEAGVLSDGWEIIQTNTNTSATPCYWSVNDYVSADFSPFGTYHAGLWWDFGHQDEWIITPEVACGAGSTLTFESTVFEGSTNLDHYYVKVSTDGGTTWTVVWDASTLTGGGWNYYDYPYSIDMSAFAGEDIKIAFQAVDGPSNDGIWYIWFIDNIAFGATDGPVMFPASSLTKISHSTNRNTSDRIARDGNIARVANFAERTPRAAMGLMGYNLYRDDALTAYVEHPTTEYFDLNLDPGTYSYHVTAIYDLTPYGFAGQIGESMIEGPIDVSVVYGYELPFTENWSTGLFETNHWTTSGANWKIAGQAGNPAPAVEFTYNPVQTDYALSLTSSWIDGTGFIDGKIYFDFDLKLDDVNATGEESLAVEVYNGAAWVNVASYTADGDMPWEMKHVDITNQAKNKVFRVRFNAKGVNTLDIFNWLIDNIHIYRYCPPPVNLVSQINFPTNDEVHLTWEAPEGGGTGGVSGWLLWDNGVNDDAIGLTGGGTFSVAVRFTPAQLGEFAGTSLTKIRMFPLGPNGTIVLKVWTGANASQLVLTQPVASYTAGQWNEFMINTPVLVTGATELWFGYTVTHNDVDYVAGCDAGPAVAGFGDMISLDGSVWESMATAYALNFNWNLEGFVETLDGVTALQPISDNTVYGPVSKLVRANVPMLPNATVSNTTSGGSRELMGYNVYRDGALIGNTAETEYFDPNLPDGYYCYVVTAVYEDCESDPSNERCELVNSVNSATINAVSVYPNPSNSVVNIELTNDISQIVIYNYVGQVVYEQIVTKDKNIQLNVRTYEAGAYLIKFITNSGDSFTQKVAVTH